MVVPAGNFIHHPPLQNPAQPANEPDITKELDETLQLIHHYDTDTFTSIQAKPEPEKVKSILQYDQFNHQNTLANLTKAFIHNDELVSQENREKIKSYINKLIKAGAPIELAEKSDPGSIQTIEHEFFDLLPERLEMAGLDQETLEPLAQALNDIIPPNLPEDPDPFRQLPEAITSALSPGLQAMHARYEAVVTKMKQEETEKLKISPDDYKILGLPVQNLLINAVQEGHTHQVKPLAQIGDNLDLDGPLILAAKIGQSDAIKPLVTAGANVNGNPPDPKDEDASSKFLSPATLAFKEGYLNTAKKLEELGGVNDYSDRFIKLIGSIQQTSDKKTAASKKRKRDNDDPTEKPTTKRKTGG